MIKPPKYRNVKVEYMGIKFDSKRELSRYQQLLILAKAGKITDLRRQVSFELAKSVKFSGSPRAKPAVRYFADFTYLENGKLVIEDVKSTASMTDTYRLKKHLMLAVHGLEITEIK